MKEEFNLSKKIEGHDERYGELTRNRDFIWIEDVKEFIRLLKEELSDFNTREFYIKIIDKLAGEKLK